MAHRLKPMVEKKEVPYPWFADRMKRYMKNAGVNVRYIQRHLNVTYESARKWSRGLALPEDHRRVALASLLGVSDAELFSAVETAHTDKMHPELDALLNKARMLANAGELSGQQIDTIRSVLVLVTGDTRAAYIDAPQPAAIVTKKQATA